MKAAGVRVLAGTDAPNPGTSHGVSMHRELELLVQAGMTPLEALAAGTSLPADVFGLAGRGYIASGRRADLVLVEGDPTSDIKATRAIVGVWKRGIPVDLASYRALIEQRRGEDENRAAPAGSESGLVSDFEDGTTSTKFGAGWFDSTDSIRGGKSTVQYSVVSEGVHGAKGSLQVTGEVMPGFISWAGVMFFPGATPGTPANLSGKSGLSFWAKGDGREYSVRIFAGSFMAMPASVSFKAQPEWQEFTFSFAQFGKLDSHAILGVLFAATGAQAGQFRFQIDDVRFLTE